MQCFRPLLLAAALLAGAAQAAPIDDLVAAAEFDNAREVRTQLVRGVDPNAKDQRGRTAMGMALREGSSDAFKALLDDPRVDVNAPNDKDETPLMLAAIKGRLDWAQALVRHGAKVNRLGWSPLHYACSGPDGGVAAWLIQQGADINARSPNGSTPLMMAARYGMIDTVPVLLKAGADTTLKNEQGLTALDFALRAKRDVSAKQISAAMPH